MTAPEQQYLTIPFPSKILLHQLANVEGPCWEWTGSRDIDGYGRIKIKRETLRLARVVFQWLVGDIRPLQLVMHICDNPPCCNPAHLRLGTTADNIADRNQKFRQAYGIRSGSAKLTDEKVLELRRRYAAGESTPKIARDMQMSTSTIQNVIYGRTWKHVDEACTPRKTWERKK
jgi:hypothetical protein